MIFGDSFIVDDSIVDDSIVEARDRDKNLMSHSDDGDEFVSTPVPSCTDYIKQNLIRGQTRNMSVS